MTRFFVFDRGTAICRNTTTGAILAVRPLSIQEGTLLQQVLPFEDMTLSGPGWVHYEYTIGDLMELSLGQNRIKDDTLTKELIAFFRTIKAIGADQVFGEIQITLTFRHVVGGNHE